jgi:flagellar biosynthetic protein FlhB
VNDAAEKSFAPTRSRIERAKREGDVVRAPELSAAFAFAAAFASLAAAMPFLCSIARGAVSTAASGRVPTVGLVLLLAVAFIPAAAAAASSLAVAAITSGGVRIVVPKLRFDTLDPRSGIRRLLSGETLFHALRAAAVAGVCILAVAPAVRDVMLATSAAPDVARIATIAWSSILRVTASAIGLGVLSGVLEFGVARRRWLQKLRMSLTELKRELRENDGDPGTRARRKLLHGTLARGAIARVTEAAFVVVNPTHVAIGLSYKPPLIPVPVIVVRAADGAALRVRELARTHGIPTVEDRQLARALFAEGVIDRPISTDYYVAVAEIVCALVRSGALG